MAYKMLNVIIFLHFLMKFIITIGQISLEASNNHFVNSNYQYPYLNKNLNTITSLLNKSSNFNKSSIYNDFLNSNIYFFNNAYLCPNVTHQHTILLDDYQNIQYPYIIYQLNFVSQYHGQFYDIFDHFRNRLKWNYLIDYQKLRNYHVNSINGELSIYPDLFSKRVDNTSILVKAILSDTKNNLVCLYNITIVLKHPKSQPQNSSSKNCNSLDFEPFLLHQSPLLLDGKDDCVNKEYFDQRHSRVKRDMSRPDFTITVNETQIGPVAKIEPFIEGERYEIVRMIPPPEVFFDDIFLRGWKSSTLSPTSGASLPPSSTLTTLTPEGYQNYDLALQYPVELDPNSGIFSIPQNRHRLDYETAQTIELFINIFTLDGGQENQRVVIKVRDVNDEKPRFVNSPLPLQAVLPENAGPGTIVYKLLAQDADAGAYLRYSLDLDNSKKFKVDPITGTVEVKSQPNVPPPSRSGDPNALPSPFTGGGGGDIGDFGPSGTEYKLRVAVRDIAGSVDQVDIRTLSVVVGTRPPQFFFTEVDKRVPDGDRSNSAGPLDDRSDVNAYAYTINVLEDTPPGTDTVIGRIKAKSFGNKALVYELLPAMPSAPQLNELAASSFTVTPTGGDIKLLKKLDYEDFSQPKRYSFKVQVHEKDENGNYGLSSTADLYIDVIDVNDNDPIFSQPEYVKQKVPEDIPIGTDIIRVSATDLDSDANGRIKYSLSDTQNFTITADGVIRNRAALDYESTRKHSYEFTVYAIDQGNPTARTSSASVKIFVSNVNDEAPVFSRSVYVPEIAEDAKPGAVVTTVNAVDPDGDGVVYFFKGGSEYSDDFRINRDGVITINSDPSTVLRKEFYTLNVTATDDGTCCVYNNPPPSGGGEGGGSYWNERAESGGPGPRHVTEALVVVRVLDINNNKPEFPYCSEYNPTVMENSPPGTPVITVKATDNDSGDNGRVAYKIEPGRNRERVFSIDPQSGIIRTEAILDRESPGGVKRSLTVIATDQAPRPLIGVCTFSVNIGDRNDNEPSFSQSQYDTSIEANIPVNTTFLRVAAQDPDEGPNAEIHYGFERDNEFFSIDPDNGWISVKSSLLTEAGEQFNLTAYAQDKGTPEPLSSTVTVRVVVRGDDSLPPEWINLNTPESHRYTLDEISLRGTEVATLRAVSNHLDPRVRYSILPGNNPEQNSERNFELKTVNSSAVIWLYSNVDYERIQRYNLTIRAKNNALIELVTDTYITIEVIDANDNAPIFTLDSYPASVPEEAPNGTHVIKVVAEDADLTHPNNLVSYSIVQERENLDWKNFQIDSSTGLIATLNPLDRERKSYYLLKIMAKDGALSAINIGSPNKGYAYVRINVEDINDNVPYFLESLYVADVNEDAVEGTVVTEVSARDADEDFQRRYQILRGNIGGVFDVKPQTGEIYVRGKLDYELGPRNYTLTVVVSDGLNENTTTVKINVKDVNDNAPEFDRTLYEVHLPEEAETFSPSTAGGDGGGSLDPWGTYIRQDNNDAVSTEGTGLPHTILQIRATDKDTALPADIRYSLQGQGVEDGTFVVDPMSGRVKVTKKLDRDPPHGQAVWSLLALATDDGGQGNYGYADIRVILEDINDNAPYFKSSYNGYVPENSEAGRQVMTVTAIDNDEGENARLTYSIKTNVLDAYKNPIFGIEPQTGLITTQVSNLDRESLDHYTVEVEAKDKDGLSGVGTVTIHVEDRNDQQPQFTQKTYHVTVPEDFPTVSSTTSNNGAGNSNSGSGPSIISILARDADIGDNAKLTYLVKGEKAYTTYDHYLKSQAIVGDIETRYQNSGEGITTNFDKPQTFTLLTDESLNTGLLKLIKKLEYDLWSTSNNQQNNRQNNYQHHLHVQEDELSSDDEYVSSEDNPLTHRFYVLAIEVSDGVFKDWATIQISVTDVNDNAPVFEPDFLRVLVLENTKGPKFLVRFVARDIDSNENGLFDYFISPSPFQPENTRMFSINKTGHVVFNRLDLDEFAVGLDAERRKHHLIDVIARDHGTPPLIGWAKLRIDVQDINDNYPKLAINDYFYKKSSNVLNDIKAVENLRGPVANLVFNSYDDDNNYLNSVVDPEYRVATPFKDPFPPLPQSMEIFGPIHHQPSSAVVASWKPHVLGLFTATDTDTSVGFGPPFKFYSVPCDVNPLCRILNLTHVQDDGPNVNGAALVTVLSPFDREGLEVEGQLLNERQKWLDYPIKICDAGIPPLCGIDHLRVIIGDLNDNPTTKDDVDDYLPPPPRSPLLTTTPNHRQKHISNAQNLNNPPNGAAGNDKSVASDSEQQHIKNRIKRQKHGSGGSDGETFSTDKLLRPTHRPNHKDIFVFNFKGNLPDNTKIGTVFASDRDDWIFPGDKQFIVLSSNSDHQDISASSHVRIDNDLGHVYLYNNPPDGVYNFEIEVTDVKKTESNSLINPAAFNHILNTNNQPLIMHTHSKSSQLPNSIRATLKVIVKRFDEDALINSASLSISGLSPEQFLGQSASYFDSPLEPTYAVPGTNDHSFIPISNSATSLGAMTFDESNHFMGGGGRGLPRLHFLKRLLLDRYLALNFGVNGRNNDPDFDFEILSLVDSSLLKHGRNFPKSLDLRFAVRKFSEPAIFDGNDEGKFGGPRFPPRYEYVPAVKLNALLWKHKLEIESLLLVNITDIDIPISITKNNNLRSIDCKDNNNNNDEGYFSASKTSQSHLLSIPYLVDTNRTAVLSHLFFFGQEGSYRTTEAADLTIISCITLGQSWCSNGGFCVMDPSPRCICPRKNMGPQCQITTISLKPGGWILLPTLPTNIPITYNENYNVRLKPISFLGDEDPFDTSSSRHCRMMNNKETNTDNVIQHLNHLKNNHQYPHLPNTHVISFDFIVSSHEASATVDNKSNPPIHLFYLGPMYLNEAMKLIKGGVPVYTLTLSLTNNELSLNVNRIHFSHSKTKGTAKRRSMVLKGIASFVIAATYSLTDTSWHHVEIVLQENYVQANLDRYCNHEAANIGNRRANSKMDKDDLIKGHTSTKGSTTVVCQNGTRILYDNVFDSNDGTKSSNDGSKRRTLYDYATFGSLTNTPIKYSILLGLDPSNDSDGSATLTGNTHLSTTCFRDLMAGEHVYDFGIDTLSQEILIDECAATSSSIKKSDDHHLIRTNPCPLGFYGADCELDLKPITFGKGNLHHGLLDSPPVTSPLLTVTKKESYVRLGIVPPSVQTTSSIKFSSSRNDNLLMKVPSVFKTPSNVIELVFRTLSPKLIQAANLGNKYKHDKIITQRLFQSTNLDGSQFIYIDIVYPKNYQPPSNRPAEGGFNNGSFDPADTYNLVASTLNRQSIFGYVRCRYSLGGMFYANQQSNDNNNHHLRGDQIFPATSHDTNDDLNDEEPADFFEVSTKISPFSNMGQQTLTSVVGYCPIADGAWKYLRVERTGLRAKILLNCTMTHASSSVMKSSSRGYPTFYSPDYFTAFRGSSESDHTFVGSVVTKYTFPFPPGTDEEMADPENNLMVHPPPSPDTTTTYHGAHKSIPERMASLELDSRAFYLGARVREIGERKFEVSMQFDGCIKDFRFDSVTVPLASLLVSLSNSNGGGATGTSSFIDEGVHTSPHNGKEQVYVIESKGVTIGCLQFTDLPSQSATPLSCGKDYQLDLSKCPSHLICLRNNGYFSCECPFGTVPRFNTSTKYSSPVPFLLPSDCVPFDVCQKLPLNPCQNGGRCFTLLPMPNARFKETYSRGEGRDMDNNESLPLESFSSPAHFKCVCEPGWGCPFCDCPLSPLGDESSFNYKKRMIDRSNDFGISRSALLPIVLALLFVIIMTSILIFYVRCFHARKKKKADELIGADDTKKHFNEFGTRLAEDYFYDDEDDAIARQHKESGGLADENEKNGENVMTAGGEFDSPFAFDIARLRKPVLPSHQSNGYTGSKEESRLVGKAKPSHSSPYHQLMSPRDHNKTKSNEMPPLSEVILNRLRRADSSDEYPSYQPFHFATEDDPGLSRRSIAGSLSSLGSGDDESDINFDDINDWGPKFQKIADMCGI